MNTHRISRLAITGIALLMLTAFVASAATTIPDNMVSIPAGTFEMGDHHDLGGAEHRSDEVPIHTVSVDTFFIQKTEVTNQQYVEYLNSALSQGLIEVKAGFVYGTHGDEIYCETRQAVPYSRIDWDSRTFSVLDQKEQHPMVGVRWLGAAAYTNWLSAEQGYEACYDLATGTCEFSKKGFRLPTEAEWEYAGRGGQYGPYVIFPWGNDDDMTKANWPRSGDPYESGSQPWTTPVGFYNGELHQKSDFGWSGKQASYQTANGSNGYGLYDMAGNVWEWWFFDHVVQDVDPTKLNYVGEGKTIADYPGKLNLNLPGRPVRRDWLHCNSLDYNAKLDQIVINSVQGEFYVIDHGKTFISGDPEGSIALAAGPAGDFMYRFGDPARYGQGEPPSILEDWTASSTGTKQIGGSHDIQWIQPGLPGAGHFLVFNNGQYLFENTPQSYIFEINGFLDAQRQEIHEYVNPPDAGYYIWKSENSRDTHKQPKNMSNQIVWIYGSKSNQGFFSHIGSGAQRLPNGNTLICADTEGHLFEVTPAGEVVWEYINPATKEFGTLTTMPDAYPMTNAVFRAYRYAPDHPALAGKDLTPQGTITEAFPQEARPARKRPSQKNTRRQRPARQKEKTQ